jgi:hypothetical protein
MQSEYDPVSLVLEPIEVRPRKTDIDAAPPLLVWLPYAVGSQGSAQPLA